MRIAVLSDPHGDLVALEKVIDDLERAGHVDEVVLGGDLAQGGPQPAEVVDEVRRRGWRSVRGNGDDLLAWIGEGMPAVEAMREAVRTHGNLPPSFAERAEWSAQQLGSERTTYLRNLPLAIELGRFELGTTVLVHATPWSTEDVVLPDADEALARRMLDESGARLLAYGHIHTPYQRHVDGRILMSVGAVSGSNDEDPRPAYTILEIGDSVSVEVRRVDWPADERRAAYRKAGVDASFIRDSPGSLPVRSRPGEVLRLLP